MTTTVTIKACCASSEFVEVIIKDHATSTIEVHALQDGETLESYAYDDREISVREKIKQKEESEA